MPEDSLGFWRYGLERVGAEDIAQDDRSGEKRLRFLGPDGDSFALAEVTDDPGAPYADGPVPAEAGIHGFRGVTMQVRDDAATAKLLGLMGYEEVNRHGDLTRFALSDGNGADIIDLDARSDAPRTREGAGSVHHVAFALKDRSAQLQVRNTLLKAGAHVTPVIGRDYFWAIYFCTADGICPKSQRTSRALRGTRTWHTWARH